MLNFDWIRTQKKPIGLILLGTLLLFFLQIIGHIQENDIYHSEDGTLVAIEREDLSQSVDVPLIVEAEQDGEIQSYEIMLSLGDSGEGKSTETEPVVSDIDLVKASIEEMQTDLEQKDDLMIILPTQLSDGTALLWKRPSMSTDFLILLFFPLGVVYLYRNEKDLTFRKEKERKDVIRRALPAFNDQILLFMNSGLIFHDAFSRIAESYGARKESDAFSNLLIGIAQEVQSSGKSIVSVMEASKKDVAMREYSRMVNIIADNQIKGVGLKEKLESESHLLWESRKASALQKAKEIETKMTFPLAVLLLVVVMITGIPAMMSM